MSFLTAILHKSLINSSTHWQPTASCLRELLGSLDSGPEPSMPAVPQVAGLPTGSGVFVLNRLSSEAAQHSCDVPALCSL
jgi:hypothetical protein